MAAPFWFRLYQCTAGSRVKIRDAVSWLQARRTKIRSLFLQIGYDAATADLRIDERGIERDGILALDREGALDGAGSRNRRRAGALPMLVPEVCFKSVRRVRFGLRWRSKGDACSPLA
jgi:hypothetical protein